MPTLFEQLGGETRLRQIVETFVDREFDDMLIGFFFKGVDRQRVKDKEYEFAAAHLGANVTYTGRSIPAAHARHAITGGHFMRRLQILKETLAEFDVPSAVSEHWIAHTERLRPAVTEAVGSECHPNEGDA
jgi:hemoglobin